MGYVTTYQSVSDHPKKFEKLLKRDGHRWLLVLDEAHHLPELGQAFDDEEDKREAGWTGHVRPLFEASTHVLAMTGSAKKRQG